MYRSGEHVKGPFMMRTSRSEIPFFDLVSELKDETQALIKEEVALAKTEMSEKMSSYARNAVSIGIYAFVAYAGVIVLLLGIGSLLGHWFSSMGLAPHLAFAAGWGAVGLLIAAFGGIMVMTAVKTLSASSLAPEKTIETIHELKGDYAQYLPAKEREKVVTAEKEHKRSSQEIKTSVETTQKMMGDTMEELRNRMTPRYMGKSLVAGVKHYPGRTAIVSAVTGLAGFLLVRWRMHRNHAAELAEIAKQSWPVRLRWKLRHARR
jgi:hypothetical protein